VSWRDIDPGRVAYDRPRIEHAISEVIARHPMRHDEWRLGWELDRALEPLAPWLTRNNQWPSQVTIERPWLALEPTAERARVATATASLLAAFDRERAFHTRVAAVFDQVAKPRLDSAESITAAMAAVLAALPNLDGEDYRAVLEWYLEALGIDVELACEAVGEAVSNEHGDTMWPPSRGLARALEDLGSQIAAS
jgi:hypothetical protein